VQRRTSTTRAGLSILLWMKLDLSSLHLATSHTYNAVTARSVFETALAFHPDAVALLAEIEKRNGD